MLIAMIFAISTTVNALVQALKNALEMLNAHMRHKSMKMSSYLILPLNEPEVPSYSTVHISVCHPR